MNSSSNLAVPLPLPLAAASTVAAAIGSCVRGGRGGDELPEGDSAAAAAAARLFACSARREGRAAGAQGRRRCCCCVRVRGFVFFAAAAVSGVSSFVVVVIFATSAAAPAAPAPAAAPGFSLFVVFVVTVFMKKKTKTKKFDRSHHFLLVSSFLSYFSPPNIEMRPVAAVLLLSLLALVAGSVHAAEDLSSSSTGAVLIARKVWSLFLFSFDRNSKRGARREKRCSPPLSLFFSSSTKKQFVEPLPPVVGRNATVIVEVFNAGSR